MLCERKKCTGCFACFNICPKQAIQMKENEMGAIYPEVDLKKCIQCNLCEKVCMGLQPFKLTLPKKTFAMLASDMKDRKVSSSGGAATIFSRYILEQQGVVYGTSNLHHGEFSCIRISEKEKIEALRGSKYVHSYVKDSYSLVQKDLLQKRKVLFIGTPCQVKGLQLFLRKEYDDLYVIDLICHGVPPQKLLMEEIESQVGSRQVDFISFRDSNHFRLKIVKNKNVLKTVDMQDSPYYYGFMKALFYRDNCYECPFARKERSGDITIGDFWGLGKITSSELDQSNGVSVLLIVTSKGEKLLHACQDNMILEERSIKEAVEGNDQLRFPSKPHPQHDKFQDKYSKLGLHEAYRQVMKKDRIFIVLKKHIKQILKRK